LIPALASSPPGKVAVSRSAARQRVKSARAPVPVRRQGRLAITGEVDYGVIPYYNLQVGIAF